ncbi:hypothetical protein [Dyadobacter psychrotolerans]|uniref:Glycosyltransferase RgtA/B/C/D-like domain-containing protein n=1 Tax=Dyadobacter psychrotolerans TaxID=2541721 RepID=A0A4R5DLB8_9BACT|nr:hypothetical protein [Dyadobacter psychrotolerans]TDE14879.1 hypothetical protein E0F88_17020 [Dyadobacter psychrotolerans]
MAQVALPGVAQFALPEVAQFAPLFSAKLQDMLKKTITGRYEPILFVLISLAIVLIYCAYFFEFRVNYPQHEDSMMANFVRLWDDSTWAKRLDDWGGFSFGHRYYYARAVSLIAAKLNGGYLDLTVTMWGGIIMSVLFTAVFAWLLVQSGLPIINLLPAVLLLFNPRLRDYIFWALTNQLYPPSLLFALLAVILVLKDSKLWFVAAVFSALIAAGSFSSGLLAFPSVALALFLRRKYPQLLMWLLVTAVTFALYFRNYNHPGWGLPYINPGEPSFTLFNKLIYLVTCTGGVVMFEPGKVDVDTIWRMRFWPSILLGSLCWAILLYGIFVGWFGSYLVRLKGKNSFNTILSVIEKQYLWFKAHPKSRLFFTSVTALLFVTTYMVIIGRTNPADGSQIFEKRLKLYPIITEILAYSMALVLFQAINLRKLVFYTGLAGSFCIWLLSYFFLVQQTKVESRNYLTLIFNYKNNNNSFLANYGAWGGASQQGEKAQYEPSIKAGVLTVEFVDFLKGARMSQDTSILPVLNVISQNGNGYDFLVPGIRSGERNSSDYFVILKNQDYEFLVNLNLERNTILQFLKTRTYYIGELRGNISNLSFPEGEYQVGILKAGTNPVYRMQSDRINIKRKANEWW